MSVFTIRRLVKSLFRACGFNLYRRGTMPRGLDLVADLQRLFGKRRPSCIFDVGANLGQTARQFSEAFPAAVIYSIEPVRESFDMLVRNVRDLENVKPHNLALGASDGTAEMQVVADFGTNRIMDEGSRREGVPTEKVELRRLDTFCGAQGIDAVDLLKTDCEGHDFQVLQGAAAILAAGRVGCVYCEVSFRRDGAHADFFAIESFLREHSFSFYALYDYSGWQYDVSKEGFANALFVRDRLLSQVGG